MAYTSYASDGSAYVIAVIAAIPTVFNVSLPDESYTAWINALSWPNFLDSIFLPTECYGGGYFALLISTTLWPIVLIFVMFFASVAWECACKAFKQRQQSSWREGAVLGIARALPSALFLSFLCIISASTRVFKVSQAEHLDSCTLST
eukprot:1097702-Pleurochrysis_carterae.AAC.11